PMRVLDAWEEGELVPRPKVHFELRDAIDDVIVDALAVSAVRFPARLPVAFQDVSGIGRERSEELRACRTGDEQRQQGEHTAEVPGTCGDNSAHNPPLASHWTACRENTIKTSAG